MLTSKKPYDSPCSSFVQLLQKASQLRSLPPTGIASTALFPWILWNLWQTRNKLLFEERFYSEKETSLKSITDAMAWYEAQLLIPKIQTLNPQPQELSTAHLDICVMWMLLGLP